MQKNIAQIRVHKRRPIEERGLQGIFAAVVILDRNLLQIAECCTCLSLHIIKLVSSLCATHKEGKLCDS